MNDLSYYRLLYLLICSDNMKNENIIVKKTFDFSLHIIDLYKILKKEWEYVLSKQLLRSGTSIWANVNEATAAPTKKDFINKMSIASKESRETIYWLKLLQESEITYHDCLKYIQEAEEIIRILTSIVKTSQSNIQK